MHVPAIALTVTPALLPHSIPACHINTPNSSSKPLRQEFSGIYISAPKEMDITPPILLCHDGDHF